MLRGGGGCLSVDKAKMILLCSCRRTAAIVRTGQAQVLRMHSKKRADDAFSLIQKSDLKVFIAIVAILFAVVVLLLTTLARVAFSDPLPCKACASPSTSSDDVGAEAVIQSSMPPEAVPLRPLNGTRGKLMRTPEVRLRAVSIQDDVSNEVSEIVEEIADDFPSPLPLLNEVDAETDTSDEAQQALEEKSDALALPKAEFFLGSQSPMPFIPTGVPAMNNAASASADLPPPVQSAFAIEVQPAEKDVELPPIDLVDFDTYYDSKPRLMDATILEEDPIPLPEVGDSNGTEVDTFNRTVLADQPIDSELEGAKSVKSTSKECPPLNPYDAAKLHPMSERRCGNGLPGWQDPSGKCFCTYFPAEWDKNDCPSKYYTMCWRED